MRVSFIIPHKGREELLEQTLRSLFELDRDPYQLEIIIVTQNSALECPAVQQSYIPTKVVFCADHETISTLRNTGVNNASGEYIAFIDADIQLSQNWLHVMFEELQANPQRVLVGAAQRCGPDAKNIEKAKVILSNNSADKVVEFLNTANLFMSRRIFEKVGGFPEEIMTCEDYYFTNKVNKIGELYRTSRASFVHLGEDKNYRTLFRKEMWRGQSNLHTLKGRKIVLREIPSLLTPIWQVIFFLIVMVNLALGNFIVTCLGLLFVSLPTILYAIRLYKAGHNSLSFLHTVCFYCVYHSARAIGIVLGLFKRIKT